MAISKEELEAKVGGNPNLVYQGQKVVDKTVRRTVRGEEVSETVRVPVVMWIDKRTGYTVTAEVEPGGETYTVTYDGIDEKNKDTATTSAATQKPPGGREGPEGTPDGQGGFDNTRPRWVVRDKNGTEVFARPLEPAERLEWERDQNQSAGRGRKTDKEVQDEQQTNAGTSTTKDVPDRPGWTATTTTRRNPQTGVVETTTTYNGPNGPTNTLPEKPQTAKPEKDANGNWGYWDIKPGQSPTWVPIQGGPNTQPQRTPVQVNGVWGTWKPGQSGEAPTFEPMASQPGQIKLPPDAPQLDLTDENTAYESYQRLFTYVNQKVTSGEWTAEQGKNILAGPHAQVGMTLDRAKERRVSGENLRRDQLTERSQDMTQTGNRLSFSQGASNTAITRSGQLMKEAGGGESTIVPLMVLQAGMGKAMGGFQNAPNVTGASGGGGLMPRVAEVAGAGYAKPSDPNTVGTPTGADVAAQNAAAQAQAGKAFSGLGIRPPMTPEAARANPVFRPPPPIGTPTPSAGPAGIVNPADIGVTPPQTQAQMSGAFPSQVMKSGMGAGTRTIDDLSRELLSEGYSPEEIDAARRRAMARAGFAA